MTSLRTRVGLSCAVVAVALAAAAPARAQCYKSYSNYSNGYGYQTAYTAPPPRAYVRTAPQTVYVERPVYLERPVYVQRPVVVERPVYVVPRRHSGLRFSFSFGKSRHDYRDHHRSYFKSSRHRSHSDGHRVFRRGTHHSRRHSGHHRSPRRSFSRRH